MQRLELAHLKKTLTVLFLAVLVLSVLLIITVPRAKADVSEAKVLNTNWYAASSSGLLASSTGDLVVVGEVENVGSGIVQNVTLSATATSSNGTTLGTASTQNGEGTVFTYETLPQEKAPFVIDFPSSASWSSQVSNVNVTVVSVLDATSPPYQGLNMIGTPDAFNDSGIYTVVGTIINNGSQTMGYVWVVTTFYNSAGQVVGLNFTNYLATPSGPVVHDGAVHYVATPIDNTLALTNEISTYSYVIDSIPYGTGSSGQSTPTPTSGGSNGASSQYPWLLPVVVVVVIAVVAVATLMLLRKRPAQPETEFPPPPPPPPPEA